MAVGILLYLANCQASSNDNDYYLRQWPNETEYEGEGTTPLYIGLSMSFGGDFVAGGAVAGVQVALNQINSDPYMLPGYTLHYTLTDSQVMLNGTCVA